MFFDARKEKFYLKLPDNPGVYLMYDAKGKLLYVGKAASLKKRVSSYFMRAHDLRIERLVSLIAKIETRTVDTVLEALILETKLIKELDPPFNIREKDGKSFLSIEITREPFPRVLLVRSKDKPNGMRFGPFVSPTHAREALRMIRRIFPFHVHPPEAVGKFPRPCFDAQVGLCPGVCIGAVSRAEYARTIRQIKLFFAGKKARILQDLAKEMSAAAKKLDFEKADSIKKQIFALQHIQDTALISRDEINISAGAPLARLPRIEGYDISNISGTSAVGSMVVFVGDLPEKSQYRKFKIRNVRQTSEGGNDVGMLKEVLSRRFARRDWALPDLVLVDGGAGQVNAAKSIMREYKLRIPIVGMVKGPDRKRTDIIGLLPKSTNREILTRVRDEAHRFAIAYHRELSRKRLLGD